MIAAIEDYVGKQSPIHLIKASLSPFVPRNSGYGIKEDGTMAIVSGPLWKGKAVIQMTHRAAHEVLHEIISNPPIWNNSRLKGLFEAWLTRNQHYRDLCKAKFKQYGYLGFFEENLVLAVSHILLENLNLLSGRDAKATNSYLFGEGYLLVPCFYDNFNAHYDRNLYSNIDEFIIWMFENSKIRTS